MAEDLIAYYDDLKYNDNFFEMTAFDETGVAGHLIMRFIDEEKTILRFGFVIVDDQKRGMGYGKEMLRLALQYAFEILRVKKVTLGVFENNPAAYHCYQAAGFKSLQAENQEYYPIILGEKWKCLELSYAEGAWGRNVN